jgi:hypothetical protein
MFYPPTKKRRSKYQGPPTCTVQVENIGTICGLIVAVGTVKLSVLLNEQ